MSSAFNQKTHYYILYKIIEHFMFQIGENLTKEYLRTIISNKIETYMKKSAIQCLISQRSTFHNFNRSIWNR